MTRHRRRVGRRGGEGRGPRSGRKEGEGREGKPGMGLYTTSPVSFRLVSFRNSLRRPPSPCNRPRGDNLSTFLSSHLHPASPTTTGCWGGRGWEESSIPINLSLSLSLSLSPSAPTHWPGLIKMNPWPWCPFLVQPQKGQWMSHEHVPHSLSAVAFFAQSPSWTRKLGF